jgi:hypothetical protein
MARRRTPIEDHHAEWLSLVETSGPFLTMPVLKRALPGGLETAPRATSSLRMSYQEWREDSTLRWRWIRWVLEELLELAGAVADAGEDDPSHRIGEHGITLRPTFVVRDRTREGEPVVLLVHVVPAGMALDRSVAGDKWAASPVDRAAELARAVGIELALVTDGARWALVWAREGETVGTCTWRAELWLEEPLTLRAFSTLLGARRFFALLPGQALGALLKESAERQQEVADQLGAQVRRAVELLITTLDREDRERHGALLTNVVDADVYRGAVTVMMRLVFLFVAEERRLLPIDESRYAETLAASTLRAQLQERADRDGEDPLERSTAAWHRVLALFRAVHAGIEHDGLRLPAYGGGLFDPDRHPFLEGRPAGTRWKDVAAQPLPVDDRTMLHLLDALQTLEQQGARVLLSYSALDVEQIGHVYEGLLDHTGVRLGDHALALGGRKEPELALGEVESWALVGEENLVERLAEATGRSARAVAKALTEELTDERRARLRAACANDEALLERVAHYHALLRDDLRGDPLVLLAGSLFVAQALDRRASGTYYTPRQLAEEVVKHALDPVVYLPGPAQERDPTAWRLRGAAELLDLNIADIAMGSGAFLVAACRYLAARLLEAWEAEGDASGGAVAEGGAPLYDAPPADPLERELFAHRLVAERCLYGVDKNPMAVEMAKLSLWLLTLAKNKPFSFLDHALRVGDSLLGITDLRQLRVMHLDPQWSRQASFDLGIDKIEDAVGRALESRRELEAFVVRDPKDAERKAQLLAQADEALEDARLLGDLIVGAALGQLEDGDALTEADAAMLVQTMLDSKSQEFDRDAARSSLRGLAADWLVERMRRFGDIGEVDFSDRDPFHWAVEFPEVREHGGFDAIVGNPPFQGGRKISSAVGSQYRDFLVTWVAKGKRGGADLVAYFFLRAADLLCKAGGFGLVATNTIAQGDTREVGLDQLILDGMTIYRGIASEPWPGGANLEMAAVWAKYDGWSGSYVLDRTEVDGITPALAARSRVEGNPRRLIKSQNLAFQGTVTLGMGFILSSEEAAEMLAEDHRNAEVVRPYLIGDDLNQRPDGTPSRWVIDFREWSEELARTYAAPFARLERLVYPERAQKDRVKYPRMVNEWWKFWNARPRLYAAISSLDRCIVIARVSKTVQPAFAAAHYVFNEKIVVFSYDGDGDFGWLSSGFHHVWAVAHSTTLRTDTQYTPTDCFETFVRPSLTPTAGYLGAALHEHRSALMLDRQEGLTTTYNRLHDPNEQADDIVRLRELHVELDYAVRDAYGWDIDLGHGFHDTRFGTRFTFAPAPRQEILDRLLELNHARYADEVRQGLHAKKKAARKAKASGTMTLEFDGV